MSSSNEVDVSPFNGHAGVHVTSNNNKATTTTGQGIDNAAFNPETNVVQWTLPSDLFANSPGIAFDIGGTRCKVAYIKKTIKSNESHDSKESQVTLEFVHVPRHQLFDAISYIKTQDLAVTAAADDTSEKRAIKASGTAFNIECRDTIEREFHAKVLRVDEFSLSTKALQCLLRAYPNDDAVLFYDVSPSVYKLIAEVGAGLMKMMMSLQQQQPTAQMEPDSTTPAADGNHEAVHAEAKPGDEVQPMAVNEAGIAVSTAAVDDYPYMLAVCGSAIACTLVAAPSFSQYVFGSQQGGLSMLGLSKLLLNVSDYNELMELADRGDEGNVSLMCRDLSNKLGPEHKDYYDFMPPDMTVCPFGRVATDSNGKQESPKREDIANALVKYVVNCCVREIFWVSASFNCNTVYVAGGLFEHRLARDTFNAYFMGQAILAAKPQMKCRILKAASYLPSMGALLGDTC